MKKLAAPIATGSRLMTRDQVLEFLGISAWTLRSLEQRGLVKKIALNRRIIRYRPEHIESLTRHLEV